MNGGRRRKGIAGIKKGIRGGHLHGQESCQVLERRTRRLVGHLHVNKELGTSRTSFRRVEGPI